jgi:hypothetical protein
LKTEKSEREHFISNLVNIGEILGSNDIKELPIKLKAADAFGVSCVMVEFDTEIWGPNTGHPTK